MSGLIVPHKGFVPRVARSAFIAPNATLVGDVEIGENASIWFGVILRGDGPGIRVGENSNLQDGTVVHVAARGLMTVVGRNVTVGHRALLHACEIQDGESAGPIMPCGTTISCAREWDEMEPHAVPFHPIPL